MNLSFLAPLYFFLLFKLLLLSLLLLLLFCFLGLHLWHMAVPRLGVELELWPLAYTTATATSDLSSICDLHHSSQQCWILNPLSEARDWTCNFMVASRIRFHCTMTGTPVVDFFKTFYWSSVDLKCCICFRCRTQRISHTYKYIHPFFPHRLLQSIE